jgi:hypothetical protein
MIAYSSYSVKTTTEIKKTTCPPINIVEAGFFKVN